MPSSLQPDVTDGVPSSDQPVPPSSSASINFSQVLSSQTRHSSFQDEPFSHTHLVRGTAERQFGVPPAPEIVDYSVELDNAIWGYNQRNSDYANLLDPSFTPMSISDVEIPLLPSLYASPGLECFGSSLYTQYGLEYPWEPAAVLSDVLTVSPSQLMVESRISTPEMLSPVAKAPSGPPETFCAMAEVPVCQPASALSPTPSLSYSDPSTFPPSSPASVDDHDMTDVAIVEEDLRFDSPTPFLSPGPKRRLASRHSTPTTKKQKPYVSVSSSGAVRFPCNAPGCRQVCKTLGDLKRHENVLTHKAPSWECHRCHYQFTREDALKRHNKNLPNCTNAKTKQKGKAPLIKLQHTEVALELEEI